MKEDTIKKIETLRKQGLSVGQIYEKLKPGTRGLKKSQVHYYVYKNTAKANDAPQKVARANRDAKQTSSGMVDATAPSKLLKAIHDIAAFDNVAADTRLSIIRGLVK